MVKIFSEKLNLFSCFLLVKINLDFVIVTHACADIVMVTFVTLFPVLFIFCCLSTSLMFYDSKSVGCFFTCFFSNLR